VGLILDTSVLIASERRGTSIRDILYQTLTQYGETEIALSAVSVVELTHGIYRAKTDADRERRRLFAEEAFSELIFHPVTLAIAQLAGRIEGEQAAHGNVIAFEDLLIGATALQLNFEVATPNRKHFQRIPDLKIVWL
jgi:tRNA(fMet)-specific endonuclease VapC